MTDMNLDDANAIDRWAQRSDGLSLDALSDQRRQNLDKLLDLIGLTEQPIANQSERVNQLNTKLASLSSQSPAQSLSKHPSANAIQSLLKQDQETSVNPLDRERRIQTLLASTTQSSTLRSTAKHRKSWASDLLAAAAILVAMVSLIPGVWQSKSANITNNASTPTATDTSQSIYGAGFVPSQNDTFDPAPHGDSQPLNWWDVDTNATTNIQITINPDQTTTISAPGLQIIPTEQGDTFKLVFPSESNN